MYKEDTRVKITRNVAENTVWHSTHPDEGLIHSYPGNQSTSNRWLGPNPITVGRNNSDMDMN